MKILWKSWSDNLACIDTEILWIKIISYFQIFGKIIGVFNIPGIFLKQDIISKTLSFDIRRFYVNWINKFFSKISNSEKIDSGNSTAVSSHFHILNTALKQTPCHISLLWLLTWPNSFVIRHPPPPFQAFKSFNRRTVLLITFSHNRRVSK